MRTDVDHGGFVATNADVAFTETTRVRVANPDQLSDAGIATSGTHQDWPSLQKTTDALAVLDDPRLVLSDGYVGVDRRRTGARALVARATHAHRRMLLRLDILIVLTMVAIVAGGLLVMTVPIRSTSVVATAPVATREATDVLRPRPHALTSVPASAPAEQAAETAPAGALATDSASTAAALSPAPADPAASVPAALDTPEAMGAAALALIRYPWQKIPGYSIVFRSIADAPSPGFYGNTEFKWGQTGGTSSIYVYPGETVERLAAITAFEIGHEVDAAYVEPQGGHDQIAGLLGIHPASWAPMCDCAEQGYLSGWYSAAFSNFWSPGVGAWSSLASEPSGALLSAMEPWLDPRTT